MNWELFVDPAFSTRLCFTLLHSLWIVAILAILAKAADLIWRNSSLEKRYAIHVAAILLGVAAIPITFLVIGVPENIESSPIEPHAVAFDQAPAPPQAELPAENNLPAPANEMQPILPATQLTGKPPASEVVESPVVVKSKEKTASVWMKSAPWIVVFYLAGVVLMLARLLVSIIKANRLVASATVLKEGPLVESLRLLVQQWNVKIVPVIAQAEQIIVPTVVGLIKPTILLPASALSGLRVEELELILAHELAHIKRYDMWINLLQRLAEAILFFNPAIWYLSRRISTLREYCCDEMTCNTNTASTPNRRIQYATALLRVVELAKPESTNSHDLASLAANGRSPSEVRRRVARLFGEPLREPVRISRGMGLALGLFATLLLCSPALWSTRADTNNVKKEANQENKTDNPDITKQFTFGSKLEVLSIGSYGENPARWWDTQGDLQSDVPYRIQWANVGGNKARRQLVFRIHDLPRNATVDWKLSGIEGFSANGEVVLNGKESPPGYYSKVFNIEKKKFDLTVGIANGKWKTITKGNVNGSQSAGFANGTGIVFSGAFTKLDDASSTKQDIVTIVSHNLLKSDVRVIAIGKKGKQHISSKHGNASAVGTVNQTHWYFRSLKLGDIDHFEFQTREIEWVEVKDLPAHPQEKSEVSDKKPDKIEHEGTATISGRIVLEDGSPATSKGWMYYSARYDKGSASGLDEQYTDRFSYKTKSGKIWLRYIHDDYAPVGLGPFEVKPGETVDDVTIVLKPGFSELVKVTNEQGEPVAGATLVALPEFEGFGIGGPNVEKKTDTKGECLLEHLADTRYQLILTAPGYQPLRTAPLRVEKGEILRPTMIRSQPGTGFVRFADGTPSPGTTLRVVCEYTADGKWIDYSLPSKGSWGKVFATTDSHGRFKMDQLSTGSKYLFVVHAVDYSKVIIHDLQAGQKDVQIVIPNRRDMVLKFIGDISKIPKRGGKPFVSIRQRVSFKPVPGKQYDALIGEDVPVEIVYKGHTAIFRGLAVDLKPGVKKQQVEVALGYDQKTKKIVDLNLIHGTQVEFNLPGKKKPATNKTSQSKPVSSDRKIVQVASADRTIVQGTITGVDGKPVVGAFVAAVGLRIVAGMGTDNVVFAEGVTDRAGRYELPLVGISSMRYSQNNVIARTKDSGIAWKKLDVDSKETTINLKLKPQQLIQVKLVDATGKPVKQLPVQPLVISKTSPTYSMRAEDRLGSYSFEFKPPPKAWLPIVKSDDNGLLTVPNVPAGFGVYLEVSGTDQYARQGLSLNSGKPEKRPESDGTYRATIKNMKPGEIGTVTLAPARFFEGVVLLGDSGKPAANADINIWASQQEVGGSMISIFRKTDAKGRFRLNPYAGVRYGILAHPPKGSGYHPKQLNDLRWDEKESKKMMIKLDQGVLAHGTVVDAETGKPLQNAAVQYIPQNNNKNMIENVVTGWQGIQKTDADGKFAITIFPGPGTLVVHADDRHYILQEWGSRQLYEGKPGGWKKFAHAFQKVNPKLNEPMQAMNIQLKRGTTVKGKLVDEKGKPIPQAVFWSPLQYSSSLSIWGEGIEESFGGKFQVNGLQTGKEYTLFFLDPQNQLGAKAVISTKKPSPTIVLKPCGSAKVQFVDSDGKPLSKSYALSLNMVVRPGITKYNIQAGRRGEVMGDELIYDNIAKDIYKGLLKTDDHGKITYPALIPGATYRFIDFKDGEPTIAKEFVAQSSEEFDMGKIVVDFK